MPSQDSSKLVSRRCFLSSTAVAASATVGLSTTAAASSVPVPEFDPAGVESADFPEDLLLEYEPMIDISRGAQDKLLGIYAWRATPSDAAGTENEALCYWYKYSHQDSWLDWFRGGGFRAPTPDAHLGDHEPVVVYRDPDSGEVVEVRTTGYHHYVAALEGDGLPLAESRRDHPSHVELEVIDPWHHHNFGADTPQLVTNRQPLESWLNVRDDWFDQRIFSDSSIAAVDDPYALRDRESWWAEGTWDRRFASMALNSPLPFGLGDVPSPKHADDNLVI